MAKRIKLFILIATVFALVINVLFGLFLMQRQQTRVVEKKPSVAVYNNYFSYKGEDGKDALTILKKKTSIEQSASGLVVSINNRKADNKEKEYWSFFVNGKMAEVGPADYQTKKGDLIEWKIQKY